MSAPVLIDASWWVGGNRQRGIGKYLEAFFQKYCPVPRTKRVWLLPYGTQPELGEELTANFGGICFVLQAANPLEQASQLLEIVRAEDIGSIFLPSPFERPFSLLDFYTLWLEKNIRTEAIVFDLLPLQFPTRILASWPEDDQILYRERLNYLGKLDFLWCISPITQRVVHEALSYRLTQTKVLRFGLRTDWISAPDLPEQPRDQNLSLTISGGEWHKNLEGTLAYFAQHKEPHERLVVLCKLGLKHKLRLKLRLLKLGIFQKVSFLGLVSEEKKWRLLGQARRFYFLSHAEGLGIPLLEAQKAGVPEIIISSALIKAGLGILVENPIVAKVS